MVEMKERPAITSDYLLRNVKGYKPSVVAPVEGEPVPVASPERVKRESLLPEIDGFVAEMITKDEID
jgi:hypothetical protein